MNKYNLKHPLTKEQLLLFKWLAFLNNNSNSGKNLFSFIMNYNFDGSDFTKLFKLLTPKQIQALKSLENSRKVNTHLDNQVKSFTVYGTLIYGGFLLISEIIDNTYND
jgi:hypothetical protein